MKLLLSCISTSFKLFDIIRLYPYILLILILFFTISCPNVGYSQRTKTSIKAGEQRKAEKGLKDNRYFFYFIDSSITNLGTEEEKRLFKEAIQRDIIAQLLYMKFLFKESFNEIRKAQSILINLYRITLKRDISITRNLLNGFAPMSIESNNNKAIHYLRLGYRDMRVSEIYLGMADNYRESLYSMRLYKYVKAIKKAKHGKRYAFLSMIECKSLQEGRKAIAQPSYENIEKIIMKLAPPEKVEYYRLIHQDNYYISKDDKSFFDLVWENPVIHEIQDYQRYLDEVEIADE
ncbi:MAG: hypothetical protein SVZ03_02195 [Spirochaetota bacterium]|nr:hypothetical protein [Spirochaetota bacterium]